MPFIIDLLKKNKIGLYLSKFHLTSEELDKVYELYTLINQIVNEKFSEEEKQDYISINRNKILERILDDLVDSVKNNKTFMINDFTLEYLTNSKNAFTLLQFSSSFHFLINQNSINRINSYYSMEHFIEYMYKKSCNDKEYLKKVENDPVFSIIINNYQDGYDLITSLHEDQLKTVYNQLIGLVWYNQILDDGSIINKIANYLYNNHQDVLNIFSQFNLLGDDVTCDEYDNLLDDIINNKVKIIDGEYDG